MLIRTSRAHMACLCARASKAELRDWILKRLSGRFFIELTSIQQSQILPDFEVDQHRFRDAQLCDKPVIE